MNKKLAINLILLLSLFTWQTHASKVTTPLGQDVSTAVFIDQNKFYVGTAAANGELSVASLELSVNSQTGQPEAAFVAKAPERGVKVNNATSTTKSTMNNQIITKVTSTAPNTNNQKYLVAAKSTDQAQSTKNSISKLDPANKTEITNTAEIRDASGAGNTDGAVVNKSYAALAASADTIFVAVPPAGFDFGAVNSGIVRLKIDTAALTVQPTVKIDRAYKIDLEALHNTTYEKDTNKDKQVKIAASNTTGQTFTLDKTADLWWDKTLNRLYLGLVNAIGPDSSYQNGVCTLLVGRIDNPTNNNLIFRTTISVYGAKPPLMYLNDNNRMIAASMAAKTTSVSTFKVRTMHTSTGKDYVITVGDVVAVSTGYLTTQVNVYALPLVGNDAEKKDETGMIARIDTSTSSTPGGIDFDNPVTSEKTMLSKTTNKAQVTVGVDLKYLAHNTTDSTTLKNAAIKDIQVIGDTVYVSLAGTRGKPAEDSSEAGIFSSTAIFNQYGVIRAWTPWQRVMGVTDKVYNFGLDKNTNNFWYIGGNATETNPQQIGKTTTWSAGDANIHTEAGTLSAALQSANAFKDDYGIINLVNFDDETEGFKPWLISEEDFEVVGTPLYPYVSMMVATGFNQVAIIQTGTQDTATETAGVFNPTKSFISNAGENQNVFIFSEDKMPKIGAITCAEVARSTNSNSGWLFVGGSGGVAVLSTSDGLGWDSQTGLYVLSASADGFPGTNYSFKLLNPKTGESFTGVRKLICDGTYLYILTANNFYRITMRAKYFRGSTKITFDDTDFKVIAKAEKADEFFDVVQVQKDNSSAEQDASFVLATKLGPVILTGTGTRTVVPKFLSGPAVKLDFISTNRGGKFDVNNANGNLYVTAFDDKMTGLYCYRFNVLYDSTGKKLNITLFDEPYTEPNATYKYFYQIVDLSKMEKPIYINRNADLNTQSSQFAGSVAISPDPDKFLATTPITLGFPANRIPSFGSVVRDTASGALYMPGDFGLEVCE